MLDTAKIVYENGGYYDNDTYANAFGENANAFHNIGVLNETHSQLIGTTPEKVVVNQTEGNNYLVEYTGNLEKLIRDQHVTFEEAINMVAEANDIDALYMYIVVDESCISKLNLKKAKELGYKFVRKN